MSVSCECCVVRSLRQTDHSSREVLPKVFCVCVCVSVIEENHGGGLGPLEVVWP